MTKAAHFYLLRDALKLESDSKSTKLALSVLMTSRLIEFMDMGIS